MTGNTADAIVAEATATRTKLTELHEKLQVAIDQMVLNAANEGRQLTDDEKTRRTALRAKQVNLQAAFDQLAFATVARLDQSEDVKQLQSKLQSINANLSDDLARLKAIAAFAAIAAQIADGLAKLAEQVAGLVAKA